MIFRYKERSYNQTRMSNQTKYIERGVVSGYFYDIYLSEDMSNKADKKELDTFFEENNEECIEYIVCRGTRKYCENDNYSECWFLKLKEGWAFVFKNNIHWSSYYVAARRGMGREWQSKMTMEELLEMLDKNKNKYKLKSVEEYLTSNTPEVAALADIK